MIHLDDIESAAAPTPIAQGNFETIDRDLYSLKGTLVAGLETTLQSAPTTGAHVLDELFTDANGAKWVCTVAGTPGTWKQLTPAVVDAIPTGTIADGYWVVRRDQNYRHYTYHLSGTTWVERLCAKLTASATLDFGSINAAASADLTITVTGAAVGDPVALATPAAPAVGVVFWAFVSATNTVTVRAMNITGSAVDPASATYRVTVIPQ